MIIEEKVDRIQAQNYLAEGTGEDELGDATPLSPYFYEYRQMISEQDWSDFVDVAKFFEDRRHRIFGNMSILLAGVIGGIIGAIIGGGATLYAASYSRVAAQAQIEEGKSPPELKAPL